MNYYVVHNITYQLKNDSYGLHERIERGHHGLR